MGYPRPNTTLEGHWHRWAASHRVSHQNASNAQLVVNQFESLGLPIVQADTLEELAEAMGGVFAYDYLAGSSLDRSLVYGRIAAQNAAAYVRG